ncbi:MAG: tRNA pseudouridine(55) synthase TruB [Candidatus Moraniibacteriota bacterium]
MQEGIFAVYKQKGITSNEAVMKIKKSFGGKKVGHAGTLDPLAEGVLVVGVGREATKNLSVFVQKEKEYEAVVKLGTQSETDDEEGVKKDVPPLNIPDSDKIKKALKNFEGVIEQTPPFYSAVKVNGKEAYKRIRKGEKFKLKPRKVFVEKIDLIDYCWPNLELRITTGPGVYIRSIARDLGDFLETAGYLKSLKRNRVGSYTIEDSFELNNL